MTRKLFETDERRPALRLVTETYPDNPYRYVRLQERDGSGWTSIGVAELHPVLGCERDGDLATDGVVAEWAGPYSMRAHHRHRLRVDGDGDGLVVHHDYGREGKPMYVGDDPDPLEWVVRETWRITADDVQTLEVTEA